MQTAPRAISVPLTPVKSGTQRSLTDSGSRRSALLAQMNTQICTQVLIGLRTRRGPAIYHLVMCAVSGVGERTASGAVSLAAVNWILTVYQD